MSERSLAVVVPAYNEEAVIERTLQALYNQTHSEGVLHILVNNASTDRTREVAESFGRAHEDFPLVIIDEEEKGTGAASDTGFLYAIGYGSTVIARTDADTLPRLNWTQRIIDHFSSDARLKLLGGKRMPRKDDEWYCRRDSVFYPLGVTVAHVVSWGENKTGGVSGSNMATTADAYVQIGGFPRSSLETTNEDRAYELAVQAKFGKDVIKMDRKLIVDTSMRRLRKLGYMGLANYYLRPESRMASTIDIRPAEIPVLEQAS